MADWKKGLKYPEREAREERRRRIPAGSNMRGMFFASTIEIVRRQLGEDAAQELTKTESGSSVSYSGLRSYPLDDFMKLQTRAAEKLLAKVPTFEDAVFVIGEACVEIFFESVAGRTMKLLAGSDPHRLMSAAPNGYGLGVSDGGTRGYERAGATEGRFWFKGDILGPCHQVGTFTAAIRGACGIAPDIRVEQTDYTDFVLHVTWGGAST